MQIEPGGPRHGQARLPRRWVPAPPARARRRAQYAARRASPGTHAEDVYRKRSPPQTTNSSRFLPCASNSVIQRAGRPRPLQIWPSGPRYFTPGDAVLPAAFLLPDGAAPTTGHRAFQQISDGHPQTSGPSRHLFNKGPPLTFSRSLQYLLTELHHFAQRRHRKSLKPPSAPYPVQTAPQPFWP